MAKLKDEINSDINNKLLAIEEKLKILDALGISSINSELEKDNIKMIEKKINDLLKRSNDLENSLKFHLKKMK